MLVSCSTLVVYLLANIAEGCYIYFDKASNRGEYTSLWFCHSF